MRDLEGIAADAEALAEELADHALEVLRAAHERGETGRPEREKVLTQARRSLEKASGLLRRLG
ncbi:MAG: hypothetical protein EBU70_00505 [Actinobacteria bacterium]|nr:hypothetical protein [Actinomycetota bacterium]